MSAVAGHWSDLKCDQKPAFVFREGWAVDLFGLSTQFDTVSDRERKDQAENHIQQLKALGVWAVIQNQYLV